MKPEDRKRLKQHIEMVVEHKTPIEELEDMNRKLRLELSTLRFKEAQEQRFIWWIWNVYVKNVEELITDIMRVTTYDTEGEAKEGKYSLPKHCFDLMKKIDEYTEHIYDGTLLDVEMSTDVKNDNLKLADEVMTIVHAAISGDCQKYLNYDLRGNRYCKWGVVEKDIRALFETSTDNNKCMWTQESDPEVFPNLWRAGCGNSFYLDAEKPSDNHMKYCCYCGKEIAEGE